MKKLLSVIMIIAMLAVMCVGCGDAQNLEQNLPGGTDFSVGVCQAMEHPSLSAATDGFVDALNEEMKKAGKTIKIDVQVAGESNLCGTVVNAFIANDVDLIMGNATPALLAAGNATTQIPVLGTSITDYEETFEGNIPANVTGTSDAVPFAEQAQMMIDTLNLVEGDVVGVLYCSNESNSEIQYQAVKALFEGKGIVVKAYTFSETNDMQPVVNAMAGEVKAVYVPSDNTVATNDTVVGTICGEKNVPVYTSYGGSVCYASLAIDYYELGYETGKMAAQILLGEKSVSDIEIKTLTPTVSYNKELCDKLGITVPEN